MARSVALNPASMPFFPGARTGDDEGGNGPGIAQRPFRPYEQDLSSSSTASLSPSDYRSVRSSPSPPSVQSEHTNEASATTHNDVSRQSPTIRQVEGGKPYPVIESRIPRESSMFGSLESLPEGEDYQHTPGPTVTSLAHVGSISSFYSVQQGREQLGTPPVPINNNGSPYIPAGGFTSSSPVSSLDSSSQFAPSVDSFPILSFEEHLKASNLFKDILDRLVRCEFTTRQIQNDLGDIHSKINLMISRTLQSQTSSQPEFKDPFATGPSNFGAAVNGARGSVGNIAPNQIAPLDDISTISQRLNTLTSSVGQLLALQTQHIQNASTIPNQATLVGSAGTQLDLNPNIVSNPALLGHGIPGRTDVRPSPRVPNQPMRTWSTGTLDLPVRPVDANVGRQDPLRDKRRSVTGLLRRDSAGVVDLQGDSWSGGNRDSGPLISKWEHLNLSPDLLRSLNKFGVGPPNKIQQRALPFLLRGADIIAQAPPTQERIAAYVIPAIQIALTSIASQPSNRGPFVIMISTTVDQATQAQRMIRDLGGPIGVRSALGVGTTLAPSDLAQELRLLQQNMPHILCGTPQKLHALFTSPGALPGSEVRFLVLDEVDQLIARNLHEFVFNIVKLLPSPRSRPLSAGITPANSGSTPQTSSNDTSNNGLQSPFNSGRRFSTVSSESSTTNTPGPQAVERQTALFSNTVPQDVLNLATAIQLREPVRVLVRRDGNITQVETTQGSRGLRQYYLYLAFTGGSRPDPVAPPGGGLGIIGSGRGATSAESVQAREWKLDALADLFDDLDVPQAIVHVGGMTALDSVVYKLASRGLEAVPLHGDMSAATKLAALNKYRGSSSLIMRPPTTKVLVVYDVQVKEISHIPLVVNYDLPKAVEEYAHRVAPAIAPNNYTRAGVVINFVTATGGDVEMLRSIECFYKIKCPEVPMSLRDLL